MIYKALGDLEESQVKRHISVHSSRMNLLEGSLAEKGPEDFMKTHSQSISQSVTLSLTQDNGSDSFLHLLRSDPNTANPMVTVLAEKCNRSAVVAVLVRPRQYRWSSFENWSWFEYYRRRNIYCDEPLDWPTIHDFDRSRAVGACP